MHSRSNISYLNHHGYGSILSIIYVCDSRQKSQEAQTLILYHSSSIPYIKAYVTLTLYWALNNTTSNSGFYDSKHIYKK